MSGEDDDLRRDRRVALNGFGPRDGGAGPVRVGLANDAFEFHQGRSDRVDIGKDDTVDRVGAVFDCVSLLVTVFIVRRALASNNNLSYLCYLSVDLVIAVVASMWVLFVFMLSGWVVSLILQIPETMASRSDLYQGRLQNAFSDPFSPNNLRNIYFGVIMGASALLPTLLHVFMACRSFVRSSAVMLGLVRNNPE